MLHAVDTAVAQKARGAFFTPEPLARFVTDWAVRSPGDVVMEPSCGEAAFLTHAVRRLAELNPDSSAPEVFGVEIFEESAATANELVAANGGIPHIEVADFFQVTAEPRFDAVIGNPPYIRYQDFSGEARTRSREVALRAGVALTGLASSWAAFTVHAAQFLKPGGRMGLVVPAELLSVNYAAPVREYLMQAFEQVDMVMFTERVFPAVQEEVVLLMASGFGGKPAGHANVFQTLNAETLFDVLTPTTWVPGTPDGKWTTSLLEADVLRAYGEIVSSDAFCPLEEWGDTTLGMVTGNNKFFAMSPARASELGIPQNELLRLSPPGSAHLRGLKLTQKGWKALGQDGKATLLWRPDQDEISDASLAYIATGERANVQAAYKCRVRKPWWRVPLVRPADLFLTYMNADTPRITTNEARAHHLNSVHGIYLRREHQSLGKESLPLAALNSLTFVGAEMVGRAYGGGMLKIEPREADRLPVPSPAVVEAAALVLKRVRPYLQTNLRNGRLIEAAQQVDDALLVGELGVGRKDVKNLREAYVQLAARRKARGSKKNAGA